MINNPKYRLPIIAICALALVSLGVSYSKAPHKGDIVLGEWVPNTWYSGQIGGSCEDENVLVLFSDGDQKCLPENSIIKDKKIKKVKKDDKVIAKWIGEAYYNATVIEKVGDDIYKIRYYDDIEYDVNIENIRSL